MCLINKDNKKTYSWKNILLFLIVLTLGLFYVKWYPYFNKALLASHTHSIGDAITVNIGRQVPIFSASNGIIFTIAYFKSVWKAMVLGLLIGSLVQALLPVNWIINFLGGRSFRHSFLAMILGIPTMMCTCCTAPVAVGLKRSHASVNSVVAFFLANPLLNPATLIFMWFILGWKFTIFRLIFGIITVLLTATIVGNLSPNKSIDVNNIERFDLTESDEFGLFLRWAKSLWHLIIESIPIYIIIVFLLGSFQGLLFPALNNWLSGGIFAILIFALVGTIFVVPTAGEIPIIQILMLLGLKAGSAATLLLSLPAVSIVSLLLLKPVFSWKSLGLIGGSVALCAILAGFCGSLIL